MERTLELLIVREGDSVALCSPEVGTLTRALARGALLWPGAPAGVLHTLGRRVDLVVPAGVHGRVTSERLARVHEPVGYRTRLYELAPLEGGAALVPEAAAGETADGVVYPTPYAGRFWHRASPDDPPFVEAGTVLEEGATVGLIEVMKTFTQLQYRPGGDLPARARVVRVVAGDGAEVGEGTALLELEKA
jgi:biotin carboxyl carrier protein